MHARAGQLASPEDLIDVEALLAAYREVKPDSADPAQAVAFGTSGHRGCALDGSFNEDHIAAISQAICEYRASQNITGPLLLGADTHVLSAPALETALTVFVANGVTTWIDSRDSYVPTPALSHAILRLNGHGPDADAQIPGGVDGVVITPSHNPPRDGGYKYNPPHGGPADSDATSVIASRANELLANGLDGVQRVALDEAKAVAGRYDFREQYVSELSAVIDMDSIRDAGVAIGADPMGGASVDYWGYIGEKFGLNLTVVNDQVDPTWRFMTLDKDGKIRMDCSSASAMASLIVCRQDYAVAIGNDADADRHGIVTPDAGLMNPNHYLAVAVDHLLATRMDWPAAAGVGKTLVSSCLIDRVVEKHGRSLFEVPVGFKWFVAGLLSGDVVFGGEESAGASMLRHDGTVWSTDKDGIVLCLLAAEIIARTGKTPSQRYAEIADEFGVAHYARTDAPATPDQKKRLASLTPDDVTSTALAGDAITAVMTEAPGNKAAIGGLKVATQNAWFAARPSGTESIYKIYAESLVSAEHLAQVQKEAQDLVDGVLAD